jgi:phosphate transport system permease protein
LPNTCARVLEIDMDKFLPRNTLTYVKNWREALFLLATFFSFAFIVLVLVSLLVTIIGDGIWRLNWQFISSFPSRNAKEAGILSALVGSFYLLVLVACIAVPIGVGAAIYFEQYAKKNWFNYIMEINIGTLAGIPSIIYGLLGLGLFVRILALERSLIAGALTLSLLVLPIIIISTREAIRQVPSSIQDAAIALGATRLQVIRTILFPLSLPGILTGVIFSLSRAIGETAPLIMIGALTYIAFLPKNIASPFTALPIQAFNWISRPQELFHQNAAASIIILIGITIFSNLGAILLRKHLSKKYSK